MSKYDLRNRACKFSINLVSFLNKLSFSPVSKEIFRQLIRAGTSIGANIEEADSSPKRKDLKYKLITAKKEAAEAVYWIKIVLKADLFEEIKIKDYFMYLMDECQQLLRILATITSKL